MFSNFVPPKSFRKHSSKYVAVLQ